MVENVPKWSGESPVNYLDIRESFILALRCSNAETEVIEEVVGTVDEAVVANEEQLEWPED